MSFFPDLCTITMAASGEHVRAVGWLARRHPFPTGDVSASFLRRLKSFAKRWRLNSEALGFGVFRGLHTCELCGGCRMHGNFGVPAGDLLYVAPEMIVHYIEEHEYAPPSEFIEAVLAAPLPGTEGYGEALAVFRELHDNQPMEARLLSCIAQRALENGGDEEAVADAARRYRI